MLTDVSEKLISYVITLMMEDGLVCILGQHLPEYTVLHSRRHLQADT
jgi:hypothetical protein